MVFSSAIYIAGLYTSQSLNKSAYRRFFLTTCCVLFALLVLIGVTYIATARPLGRTYMGATAAVVFGFTLLHHALLLYALKTARERVAYIVTSAFDEGETHIFSDIGLKHLDFAGVIAGLGYTPSGSPRSTRQDGRPRRHRASRRRSTRRAWYPQSLGNAALSRPFCKLRIPA
jgi:hypothetical protein